MPEEAHQEQKKILQWMALDSVFYLPLHHTTCIFSLLVHGGPATHLLCGPTYRNQHSIFHQAPKTTQYYVCFEAEKIMAGVERGRGEDKVIKRLKRADAPLLPKQSRCDSSREEGVPLTPSRHIPHNRHTNRFTHQYKRKGKHSYQTQVHRTRSYS